MDSDAAQLPLSHKLWAWFETNKKQALWGAGLVTAAAIVVAFVISQQGEKEVKASEALSNVAATPSARADTAAAYLKVAADYPKSSAAARAVVLAGGSLFVQGKFAEAQAQFEKFTREHHESPLLGQALLGIAACQEAQGRTNEAIAAYKVLTERHPGESVVPQAELALGRLYEGQNQPEQARTHYESAARGDPVGSFGEEARNRFDELQKKYPNLFAPVSAPVAPATQPVLSFPVTNAAPSNAATASPAPAKPAPAPTEKR